MRMDVNTSRMASCQYLYCLFTWRRGWRRVRGAWRAAAVRMLQQRACAEHVQGMDRGPRARATVASLPRVCGAHDVSIATITRRRCALCNTQRAHAHTPATTCR